MRFPQLPGYQYEDLLGEDPFGWTFVASHEGGKRRVIKVFKAQATSDRFFHQFFKAFAETDSAIAGVAPVLDFVYQDRHHLTACASPFYGWKGRDNEQWQVSSLKRLIAMLSKEQVLTVIREMAECLARVHGAGFFHGGLRPSAIFLKGDAEGGKQVQITDFGQIFMGGLQHLESGDFLFYTSPEQLASGDFSKNQGKRWDVYSFGVIAFQLLTGHLPRLDQLRRQCEDHPGWLGSSPVIAFGEITPVAQHFLAELESEKSVEWPTLAADPCETKWRVLIEHCLRFSPEKRPASMAEVVAVMEGEIYGELEEKKSAPDLHLVKMSKSGAAGETSDAVAGFEETLSKATSLPVTFRHVLTTMRENPVARWQALAVVALLAMLPLSCFSLLSHLKVRTVETKLREAEAKQADEVTELAAELQADVDKAATAYIRQNRTLQKNSEQLKAELNEAENTKSSLLGEAQLARQILRQTQENGDQFFRLVLENRDSDVAEFRKGRAKALVEGRKHYERLVEAYGDAPDFIVSTANALFYLGRIYKEMGEFGKALASFGEAERRYAALLEDSSTANIHFIRNIALSKSALGDLAAKSGQNSVARHYYTESSRFWTEARSQAPSEGPAAAIHIHENSLSIVECELAMDRLDAALDAAVSIGVQLTEMQAKMPQDHRVVGALAKSFSLTGRVLEVRQDNDLAKEAYQQSGDLYAQAIELDAAVDAYQLGLGNSLARVGLLSNDFSKLEGAAEVLAAVVAANPFESTFLKTLADIYGTLARNQRDGGKLENAVDLEEKAIAVLKPIIAGANAVAPDVLFSYSQRLAHLAELLGDSDKFDESRVPLREAIAVLEKISKSDSGVAEYHRALAKARGMVGFACIKIGDKSEAKEHLELARTEWESFIVSNPEDADAAQAVKWTSEQLKRLQ